MRYIAFALAVGTAFTPLSVTPVQAKGVIERACLKADRRDASRELCGCIQDVASAVFTRSEEKKAAKFFADPHLTQELRQSNRGSDERFWDKYKEFGQTAKTYCN